MMKEIEQNIIHAVFSEDRFNEVSFIDPEDFLDKEYKTYWSLLKDIDGDVYGLLKSLLSTGRNDLALKVLGHSSMIGINNLQRMAVDLKECRFKRLLVNLLTKLSQSSNNPLEVSLINEYISAIPSTDIFLLSDSIIDYLGHQCSDITRNRIEDYLKFIEEQTKEVKKVINKTN